MRADVIKVSAPADDGKTTTLYQVDYDDYHVVGYHESVITKGTFGVYESEAVANIVAERIRNGSIRPIPVEY